MKFSLFMPIAIVLFLFCYMTCISYVKSLRSSSEKGLKSYQVIILSLLFGGPALLLSYMFKEVREEDCLHHYSYLICGIAFTIVQIVAVTLLCVFGVITF